MYSPEKVFMHIQGTKLSCTHNREGVNKTELEVFIATWFIHSLYVPAINKVLVYMQGCCQISTIEKV